MISHFNKTDTFPGEAVPKDPSRYVQDDLQSNIPVSDIISRIRNTSNGIFGIKNRGYHLWYDRR